MLSEVLIENSVSKQWRPRPDKMPIKVAFDVGVHCICPTQMDR